MTFCNFVEAMIPFGRWVLFAIIDSRFKIRSQCTYGDEGERERETWFDLILTFLVMLTLNFDAKFL